MIPNFPDPYEGELLYSVLARFAERMGYPARSTSLRELFGDHHGVPAIELPNKLDRLVSVLPPGTVHTADLFVQRNTLLPLFAPFLPERNYDLVLASMKGDGGRTTQLRAGIIAGRIRPPDFFRTCPICDQENVVRFGETYWNRLHQIRGVQVCAVHSVFLEPTNVRLFGSAEKYALISAQSAQRVSVGRALDPGDARQRFLLRIAESAAWLLDKNISRPGLVAINRRYRQVLAGNGCLSSGGWVRLNRLRQKFEACCDPHTLMEFNCPLLTGSDGGWLARLFRETDQSMAPLRHLLVMAILNISAKEFFKELFPNSEGHPRQTSFPCLNAVCPQYQAAVISKVEIRRATHGSVRVFGCPHCGHQSSRPADGQSVIRVISFGHLWMERLKLLWPDASGSLESISVELNADARSVTKYAARLGLDFPRRGPRRWASRPQPRAAKRVSPYSAVAGKREAWLQLRERNPGGTISHLHSLAPALYSWLYRNDRPWFNENSPARRPLVRGSKEVDWKARDEELAERVVLAAARLKSDPGRRRRVTVRAIGLALGSAVMLRRCMNKLPRTKLVLQSEVESTEQFALFRIRRALDFFATHEKRATASDILRAAGIPGSTLSQFSSVPQAIIEAKHSLDPRLNRPLLEPQLASGPSPTYGIKR